MPYGGVMGVRVLGPVGVSVEGVEVPVPAGKPLAVLALLALAQGHAVSAEQLIVGLWGEDAPFSTSKTVQVHVSTLRSRIRESGLGVLFTPAGYVLDIDGDEIDVVRFERLAELGMDAAKHARPQVASQVLREALQLWSGEPLANVLDAPFASAEADRLGLRRVAVIQARVDADLLIGLGATLVDEVRAIAEANPYDERAWGQLMVCLYRAGKPAAALDAYRALRSVLGEDLGLEPGPELAELERQVLMHDDRLLAQPTRSARRHNLPQEMSSFIGREQELGVLCDHVRHSRLTTVTGAGGAGKTRLAIAAALLLLADPFEGVWMVELAPLNTAELIGSQLADLVGARPQDGLDGLVESIADRALLIVFDNCEHVIDTVATTASHLLRHCPNLRILATSREPMAIDGERVYRVPPLTLATGDDVDLDTIRCSDAARLFTDRATWQLPEFVLDQANMLVVVQICARLDGLPLAIELAVARLRSMSLEELAGRLDDRFRLLTGSSRQALPRQQTLRNLVDWSYDLLSPQERLILDRLSVFANGFTLEDVEAVVSDDPRLDPLELVTALLDKSLIESTGDVPGRFRLLETIREYAAERLVHRGDDVATGARLAHANHFLALAEQAAPSLREGHDQVEWLDRLGFEHDNLRAAAHTFLEQPGQIEKGLRLVNGSADYWEARGPYEGLALMKALLQHPDAPKDADAYCQGLCNASRWALVMDAWSEAEDFAAQAQQAATALSNPELGVLAAMYAAMIDATNGHGQRALERLDGFDTSDMPEWQRAKFLNVLAYASFVLDDLTAARERFEEALAIATGRGDLARCAGHLSNLATIDISEGKLELAAAHLEQAQVYAALASFDITTLHIKINLGLAAYRSSDVVTARIRYREALQFCTPQSSPSAVLCCLLGLAACSSDLRDDLVTAANLHGFIDTHTNLDAVFDQYERTLRHDNKARIRNTIGDHDFDQALTRGNKLTTTQTMDLAKTLR